jgi:hypothetical protein
MNSSPPHINVCSSCLPPFTNANFQNNLTTPTISYLVTLISISIGALPSLRLPQISPHQHCRSYPARQRLILGQGQLDLRARFNVEVESSFSSCVYFSASKHLLQLSTVLLCAVARLLRVFRASPKTSVSRLQQKLSPSAFVSPFHPQDCFFPSSLHFRGFILDALPLTLTFSHASPASITNPQDSLFQHHSYTSYQHQTLK